MAISRVTGRMLQDNLVRDNNLAVNTDTLYIDVANNKVGINTASTNQTLTVAGNIGVGNLVLSENSLSSSGDLVLDPVGNINVSNVNINNLAEPVANSDATTKFYVDSLAGNISFSISDGVTSQTIDNGDTITFNGVANQTVATVSATDIVQIGLANDVVISNSLSVNGNLTIGNLSVNSLGSGQVVYVSGTNAFATSSNLTFDGSILTVNGTANIDNLTLDGTSISSQSNLAFATGSNSDVEFTIDGTGVGRFISTTALTVPTGNTLQRPGAPDTGAVRFNTLSLSLEVYNGFGWIDVGEGLSSVTTQSITGDGSTITFTLDQDATAASIIVSTNGVVQAPSVAYVVSGNQITFAEAPLTSDVVEIRFIANLTIIDAITNSSGNAKLQAANASATLNVTGNIIPTANNIFSLGNTNNRWSNLYLSGTTLTIGNIVIKNDSGNTIAFYGPDGVTPAALSANVTAVSDAIESGTSAINFAAPNGNILGNVNGSTVMTVSAGRFTIAGNISGDYILGNGSQLTGLPQQYGNSNVVTLLSAFGSNTIVTTGNITADNVAGTLTTAAQPNITSVGTLSSLSVTGNVNAGNLSGTNISGTLTTAAQPNITSVGTLSSLTVTGNVTGSYFIGNGSLLTGISGSGSEKVILAIGDSWIGGDNKTQWTAAAERAFQRQVVNQAVGGSKSANVLANLSADVSAAGGYGNIALVVLGVGGNDKLSATPANIAAVNANLYANLEDILDIITGNGVPVIMSPAPDVDSSDLTAGLPPDNAQFINTAQYYDDPEYANIALGYPGVAVATNAMSFLINHPSLFLIPGGFHPTTTTGTETYVDIIAAAAHGQTEYSINAAIGQTFDLISFNSGIELGLPTNINTPYIDFHTSGNANVDYDSRILAFGGDGTNSGTGNLLIYVNTANVLGNISASGSMTLNSSNAATAIVNGGGNGVGNIGSSSKYFNTVFAKSTSAQYADLAERYRADRHYEPGTVLIFGGSAEVTACDQPNSHRVAGVVSANPAYLMNSALMENNAVDLALLGRVHCRVRGPVQAGDLLVTDTDGWARANNQARAGTIIGKSIGSSTSDAMVEILVGRS